MTSVEQRLDMYPLASAALSNAYFSTTTQAGTFFDSFEGLPNASAKDGHANAHRGDMATTKAALIANFKRLNCFAHLDGGLYVGQGQLRVCVSSPIKRRGA